MSNESYSHPVGCFWSCTLWLTLTGFFAQVRVQVPSRLLQSDQVQHVHLRQVRVLLGTGEWTRLSDAAICLTSFANANANASISANASASLYASAPSAGLLFKVISAAGTFSVVMETLLRFNRHLREQVVLSLTSSLMRV